MGAKEDLNPEMRALMAMAVTFLPADFKFVNVIAATREIVAGVRFTLLVNAVTNDTTQEVCALEVLEKPWVITDYGEKLRILQYSNCTADGSEYRADPTESQTNPTKINPIFQNRDLITNDERLASLDEQVLPHAEAQSAKNVVPSEAGLPQNESDLRLQIQAALQVLFNSDENVRSAIAEITTSSNAKEVQERYEAILEQLVQSVVKNIFNHSSNINDSFAYEIPIRLDQPSGPINGAVVYIEKNTVEPETTPRGREEKQNGDDQKLSTLGNEDQKPLENGISLENDTKQNEEPSQKPLENGESSTLENTQEPKREEKPLENGTSSGNETEQELKPSEELKQDIKPEIKQERRKRATLPLMTTDQSVQQGIRDFIDHLDWRSLIELCQGETSNTNDCVKSFLKQVRP